MSSLFSYELDEAQIRSTLQNSRAVEYNESSWDEFESKFLQHNTHQNLSKFKLPEFHLNINRNIVLPVIFVAALVGVSAIMLSFVDFKTNSTQQIDKGLIPNPDNFKPEKAKTATIVKKELVKTEEPKPVVKTDSVPLKIETPTVSTNPIAETNNSHQTQNNSTVPALNQNTVARTVSVPDTTKETNVSPITPLGQNSSGKKRKRRRKLPTEQIETIKAPSLLGQQEATSKEPELELKLN